MEDFDVGGMVWNPLLRTTKLIAKDEQKCGKSMGYDGTKPEKSYKIIGRCFTNAIYRVAVLELATNAWKVTHCPRSHEEVTNIPTLVSVSSKCSIFRKR
uniref:At1g59630 n=1 Tax=Arabidopsis thaliana TaxID=3702 RepID=G1JSJ7_ARATH|nr:At1g59630 [Arabidopsis thaliana]